MLTDPPEYPVELQVLLGKAKELTSWIAQRHDNLEIPNELRGLLSGLLFDLAIEHHVGIVGLVDHHVNGSAFALLRAAMETLVRGSWFQLSATNAQIQNFYDKDVLPDRLSFGDLINEIEGQPDFADKMLSHLKHSSWKAMNSYTHGGMLQLSRRVKDGGTIEPNFDPEEIAEVLMASGLFALIALRQIARLSNNQNLVSEIEAKLDGASK